MKKRFLLLIPLLVSVSLAAQAHLNSFSFLSIDVDESEIKVDLMMTQRTTLELFALDTNYDTALQQDELDAAWEVLYYYIDNKIKVLSGSPDGGLTGYRQLKPEILSIAYVTDKYDAYVRVVMRYKRRDPKSALQIVNNISEETDPYHRSLAQLTTAKGNAAYVFTRYNYLEIKSDGSNNGRPAGDDNSARGFPPSPVVPEIIRSVTGAEVIFDVSPTVEGWQRRPELMNADGLGEASTAPKNR